MNTKSTEYQGPENTQELGQRAKSLAGDASKSILDAANKQGQRGMSALGNTIDEAASFVENRVAEVVRDRDVPVLKKERVEKVAGAMHDAATYLRESDPRRVAGDIDDAVHRHPYRSMFIALGVGWVIGRLMRRD